MNGNSRDNPIDPPIVPQIDPPSAPPPLAQIQKWMQAVITHVEGVTAGIESETAREQINITPDEVEQVVTRSQALSSIQRLQIYAHAYTARLLECLREEFPALRAAIGDETFDAFAFGYLQRYPSQSYTLAHLAGKFPQFLRETRPNLAAENENSVGWPDLLIDLATLERTYSEVFDGPGVEQGERLQAEELMRIPPDRWPEVQLQFVPCFRLLELQSPVHEYATAVRQEGELDAPLPDARKTYLGITRRDYMVRRYPLSAVQFTLLTALHRGAPLADALEQAIDAGADVEALLSQLPEWFEMWAAAPFFLGIELPEAKVAAGE